MEIKDLRAFDLKMRKSGDNYASFTLSSTLYPDPSADGLELEIDCGGCAYSRYEIAK